ncbi:hypothetical protein B0H11DRAFT_2048810 [Mycena galericulata]|nr:hypothetical protein B0H11DRAFT_2048810 [Mycena galericulata]
MVLTRRAYKSIIRWLPNEVLSEVMQYASRQDLVVLCQTSRLISGLATPLLYRSIAFSTSLDLRRILFSMKGNPDRTGARRNHVRQVSIPENGSYFPPNSRKELALLLPSFLHLNSLEILSSRAQFPELLRDGVLPNLTTFGCFVCPTLSSLLSTFLNRHPTINQLDLYQSDDGLVPHLDPVQLPNLKFFSMPGSLVPAIVHDNKNVEVMGIIWYVDEPGVGTTLAALGKMGSAKGFALDAYSGWNHQPSFIGAVAENMPEIYVLRCHRLYTAACRMSFGDALEIGEHLKSFKALCILEFLYFKEDSEHLGQSERDDLDLKIVTYWGSVCAPLFEIALHGNEWERKKTSWVKMRAASSLDV